ncbi:DUF1289 domain-containing protein [Pseudaestuariivita atlantica]|uniref:Fe-S oxidoreductase n=1 Tax=Pseudaestuariivita atlantica TaxID=1317121 RepID=A0A0L1JU92_9RHOB|nr:DUF1289 domain-containing protein [Pseudaestuariivita atlantica]KNG95349.1 hypothetical protein ATO11_01615 [Pseudaestuariivita atlantica]
MTDEIWKRDEIQSPCVKICVIQPDVRLCAGCLRSIDEIAAWSRLTHEERAAIMDELPSRAGQLSKRRGGRNARLSKRPLS